MTKLSREMSRAKGYLLLAVVGAIALVPGDPSHAQTLTTLYSFTALSHWTNSDGAHPASLILSGNTLYGTTKDGGAAGSGTVFKLSIDGTGFTTLYAFSDINSDGAHPNNLILSGTSIYGTTDGGPGGNGTIFTLSVDGSGFTTLYSFSPAPCCPIQNSDGANPSSLALAGNMLFGTAPTGGDGGGTVFVLNTDGTGFSTLYTFAAAGVDGDWPYTNSGGAGPASLLLSGSTLYGVVTAGFPPGNGAVFTVNVDGTGFATLHTFSQTGQFVNSPNADGAQPSSLTLTGSKLYGTAQCGGSSGWGTVFSVNTDGTGFRNLHSFSGGTGGARPIELIVSGNTLYGATRSGGTVFKINTDGTGFLILHTFTNNLTEPTAPAALVASGNTLYGAMQDGGSGGMGTVFSIALPSNLPQLTITPAAANVIVAWPTNATGFTLQSTTNLGPSAVWFTNSAAPVVVNGQFTVTNPISGTQQFFRLSQ